jgi:hypothetical protein
VKTQILFAIIGGAGFGVGFGTALTVALRRFGPGRPPDGSTPQTTPDSTDSGGGTAVGERESAPPVGA